jgi:GNAT superfamily N-acetyltransferase
MSITLIQPDSAETWRQARALVEQYAASLGVDLSFQNFNHELDHLADEYSPPPGAFLLAVEESRSLGCVGLRQHATDIGEIKRLFIAPAARGRGLGRLLAQAIVAAGRQRGYRQLLLDTLPSMNQAHALYASMGFKPTAPYRYNPVPGTAYLELNL